jgi:transcriptional regulator with GAF, ATPase, and Fis domain
MNSTAIVSAAELLGTKLPAHDALKVVSQILRGLFEINRISISIYDSNRDDFSVSFVEVDRPTRFGLGIRLPRLGTRTGSAFMSKRPQVSKNLESNQFMEDGHLAREGMRIGASFPLVNDAGVLGTLNADWRKAKAVTSSAIDIIQAAGNSFATAASKLAISSAFAACSQEQELAPQTQETTTRSLAEIETDYIVSVLAARNWRVSGKTGAAEALALHPNTLRSRMQKLGIKRPISFC